MYKMLFCSTAIRKCPVMESSNQISITNASKIQSCCDIVAKRVDIIKDKSDLGKKIVAKAGDVEEENMEELYEIYKTDQKICHAEESILKQLEFCENETVVKTSLSNSGKVGHINTVKRGCFLPKSAIGKNQKSIKAKTTSPSKPQKEVHRKGNSSIKDFMIRNTAIENTSRRNSSITGTVHTPSLPVPHQNGRDQQTRTDNINELNSVLKCEIKSDNNNSSSRVLSSSSMKINCTSTQGLNRKSRKRKIVIKKSCDANTGLITERTFDNSTVVSRSDNESEKIDMDSPLGDDNCQTSKRFKSSFLQYLD